MSAYALIGLGTAGFNALRALRSADPRGTVRVYTDEPDPFFYFRSALSRYLSGDLSEEALKEGHQNAEVVSRKVEKVDSARKELVLAGGRRDSYDRLLIATGAGPTVIPPLRGVSLKGLHFYRSLEDARRLKEAIPGAKNPVVAGGGVLGVEVVDVLVKAGKPPSVLFLEDRVLSLALDPEGSRLQAGAMERDGVRLFPKEGITEVVGRDGRVAAVKTNQGREIPCDLLVAAVGVAPNTRFLEGSGVPVERWVVVDDRMATAAGSVYAAGDCAALRNPATGKLEPCITWLPASQMGRVAGLNMAGRETHWAPGTFYNVSKAYRTHYGAVGEFQPPTAERVAWAGNGDYRSLYLRDGRLIGACLLGHNLRWATGLKTAIERRLDAGAVRERLARPDFDWRGFVGAHFSGVREA